MDILRQTFKERLREGISRSGMPQSVLAKKLGTTPSTIQRWLSGERWPSSSTICEIANHLNKSPLWLLGGEVINSPAESLESVLNLFNSPAGEIINALATMSDQNIQDVKSLMIGFGALEEKPLSDKKKA